MHFILSFLGLAALAFSASANARTPLCTDLDKAHWMSAGAVQQKFEARGFKVVEFGVADTCYRARLEDATGQRIEGYYEPVGGQPIRRQVVTY